MPRLCTQSAVLSLRANMDFHVFGLYKRLEHRLVWQHTTITREHIRVSPVLVCSDVYVGTRQLASTSASSPPLRPRLSPRTPASKSTLPRRQTYPTWVPVDPGCQGTRWKCREKGGGEERGWESRACHCVCKAPKKRSENLSVTFAIPVHSYPSTH